MNKYNGIINSLKELQAKLNTEWNDAYNAQKASTYKGDKDYYQEIINKVHELENIITEQIKEME